VLRFYRNIVVYQGARHTVNHGGQRLIIKGMKKKLKLPKFSSEAEEAKWWDSNHELVEDTLLEAIKKGKTKEGMAMKLTRERLEPRKQLN
jgi:hypothetical protein